MRAPEHREQVPEMRFKSSQPTRRKAVPVSWGGLSAHMGSMESQQLTLGGLVEALDAFPHGAQLYVSGFGSAKRLNGLFRHRPFADGLALDPSLREHDDSATAGAYVEYLRRVAFGIVYRFSDHREDQFPTGWDTPVWVSTRHDLSFNAVTGAEMVKGFAIIRTTNLAPEQGPSIQRISDEEAIRRMRVEHLQRTGEDTVFAPNVERHLLHMLPGERSRGLQDLDEARADLADFEASLQAKKDRVARLEQDAIRNDYLLGIRDDLPGITSERQHHAH